MAFSEYLNFMRLFLIQNKKKQNKIIFFKVKQGNPMTQATKPLCYDLVVMTTNHIVEQFLHFKLLCKHLQIRSVPARNYEMISIHCTIIFRSIPFFSYCAMFFSDKYLVTHSIGIPKVIIQKSPREVSSVEQYTIDYEYLAYLRFITKS